MSLLPLRARIREVMCFESSEWTFLRFVMELLSPCRGRLAFFLGLAISSVENLLIFSSCTDKQADKASIKSKRELQGDTIHSDALNVILSQMSHKVKRLLLMFWQISTSPFT